MTLREKTTYGVRNNVTTWIDKYLVRHYQMNHCSFIFIMSKSALAAYEGGAVRIAQMLQGRHFSN